MARSKTDIQQVARERIVTLFEQASTAFTRTPERSHRYVQMALRLAAKAGIRFPQEYRRSYCRTCKHYLRSGNNATIRTRQGKLIVSCFNCGHHRRLVLQPR